VSSAPSATYVLPLRWTSPGPIEALADYLRQIGSLVPEIIVVDGSPTPLFDRHSKALGGVGSHLAPHPDLDFPMGKVNGVITGVREASQERIVIADDDVRYSPEALERVVALLEDADLVRPQNYFDELPWHARLDSARSLLNRVATGDLDFPLGDFPGTLAVRRTSFFASGAYDGNALFENLELMRTIVAAGGTVSTPLDLYVARQPPSASHFLSQRIRQAYDDFAIPLRLGVFLGIAPLAVEAVRHRRGRLLAVAAAASIGLAEVGRRRAGGSRHFPASTSILAPLWIAERSVCAWLALGARARGGVRYGDGRIALAATPSRRLRQRRRESPREEVRHPSVKVV
jgi:hypothetical protein